MGKGIRYRCDGCKAYFNKMELMAHLDVVDINVHDPRFYERCPDVRRREPKRSVEAFLRQVEEQRRAGTPAADRAASAAGTAEGFGANRNRDSTGVTASMAWPTEAKAVFNTSNPVKPPLKKSAWQQAVNGDPLADSLKWGDGGRGRLKKTPFQQCMTENDLSDTKWGTADRRRLPKSAWAQSMTESDLPEKDFPFSSSPEKNVGRTAAQVKRDKEEAMLHNPILGARKFEREVKREKKPLTTWEKVVARERQEAKTKAEEEKQRKSRMAQHLQSEIKRAAHAYAQFGKAARGQQGQQQGGPTTPPRPKSPMAAFAEAERAPSPPVLRKNPLYRPSHAERMAGQAARSKAHRHRSAMNANKAPPGPTRWVPTGSRAAKGGEDDVTGNIAAGPAPAPSAAARRAHGRRDVTGKVNARTGTARAAAGGGGAPTTPINSIGEV